MRLGYVFSRYPLITETFILRELLELQRTGHALTICPLLRVRGKVCHPRTRALRRRLFFAPAWSGCATAIHWRYLRRGSRRYIGTLASALWHNRTDWKLCAGVMRFWSKAVCIADRLERDDVEHLHAHYATHPTLVAWVVNRLTGIPYSFTAHAHDIYCHRAMLNAKLRGAKFAVAVSRFNRDHILESCRQSRAITAIRVVHCGVETDKYTGLRRGRIASRENRMRILSVGALHEYKGHNVLIAACGSLVRHLDFECRILGEGSLRAQLERQIEAGRLTSQVLLYGAATEDQVRDALHWADIFVLASVRAAHGRMDGIPVALMEAMATGLPVIGTALSGIPELIENEVSGLLVPPGDSQALAQSVLRLADPQLRRRIGDAGQMHVRQEFDLHNNVRHLVECFAGSAQYPLEASTW